MSNENEHPISASQIRNRMIEESFQQALSMVATELNIPPSQLSAECMDFISQHSLLLSKENILNSPQLGVIIAGEEIGSGGMAIVFQGFSVKKNRTVALKIPRFFFNDKEVEREINRNKKLSLTRSEAEAALRDRSYEVVLREAVALMEWVLQRENTESLALTILNFVSAILEKMMSTRIFGSLTYPEGIAFVTDEEDNVLPVIIMEDLSIESKSTKSKWINLRERILMGERPSKRFIKEIFSGIAQTLQPLHDQSEIIVDVSELTVSQLSDRLTEIFLGKNLPDSPKPTKQAVAHGDLSLNQIMIHQVLGEDRLLGVRIIDIGSSNAVTSKPSGTPEYIDPKLLERFWLQSMKTDKTEDVANPQSDVFALGVILYEMMTGHRLFDAMQEFPLKTGTADQSGGNVYFTGEGGHSRGETETQEMTEIETQMETLDKIFKKIIHNRHDFSDYYAQATYRALGGLDQLSDDDFRKNKVRMWCSIQSADFDAVWNVLCTAMDLNLDNRYADAMEFNRALQEAMRK